MTLDGFDHDLFAQRKWVGSRVKRVEDPVLLTGQGKYVGDLTIDGVLDAAFLRSNEAHARIVSVDLSGAARMPGVVAVYAGDDVPAEPLVDLLELEGITKTPMFALAREKVRFVGEAVAMVVAEDRYLAEDAIEQIVVEYEPLPAFTIVDEAIAGGGVPIFDELPDNVYYRTTRGTDGVSAAFEAAAHVFERTIHTNRFMAAPMEPRGCVADYEPRAGELVFYAATQVPHLVRSGIAMGLGIPEHHIRVVAPEVGGAFGQKNMHYPEDLCVAHAAVDLGRPVRWLEDRRENLIAGAHAKEQTVTLAAAVDDDGRITAMRARFVGDAGAYSFGPPGGLIECMAAATSVPGVYDIPEYEYEVVGGLTNKTPIAPYRGIGFTASQTAREVFFDEIARALDLDRVEFRTRNMIGSDAFPFTNVAGAVYDSGSYTESLDLAAETIGYADFVEEQAKLRAEGRYLGIGFSPFVESVGWGTPASVQAGVPFPSHDNATVTIDPTGKVTVAVSTSAHGQGHETTLTQLAADVLGVDRADVTLVQGDTARSPFGMGTFASRSAIIGGGTLTLAAIEVRDKLLAAAGALLEADAADLVIEDGMVTVRGVPQAAIPVADVAGAAYFAPFLRAVLPDPYLASTKFYEPREATYSNGCVAVIVEVDAETGLVELRRVVAVEDCGTMINPMIVEGQVRGGFVQGLGGALYERLLYDPSGQPLTTTFLDYLVPRATEVPSIEVAHLETPSPHTVAGVKGMAEGSSIAAPPAVINAVMDALSPFGAKVGELVGALPLTPETVWQAIHSSDLS